jgi:hypothetical protein
MLRGQTVSRNDMCKRLHHHEWETSRVALLQEFGGVDVRLLDAKFLDSPNCMGLP